MLQFSFCEREELKRRCLSANSLDCLVKSVKDSVSKLLDICFLKNFSIGLPYKYSRSSDRTGSLYKSKDFVIA